MMSMRSRISSSAAAKAKLDEVSGRAIPQSYSLRSLEDGRRWANTAYLGPRSCETLRTDFEQLHSPRHNPRRCLHSSNLLVSGDLRCRTEEDNDEDYDEDYEVRPSPTHGPSAGLTSLTKQYWEMGWREGPSLCLTRPEGLTPTSGRGVETAVGCDCSAMPPGSTDDRPGRGHRRDGTGAWKTGSSPGSPLGILGAPLTTRGESSPRSRNRPIVPATLRVFAGPRARPRA